MELFKVGFFTVKLIDIVDILLVTYIFYKLYTVMKGTIASQIFFALVFVFGMSFIAQLLNMQTLGWLLGSITNIWIIALIVLFQPEIRRLLQLIGKTRVASIFTNVNVDDNVSEIAEASFDLRNRGWGGLIVIERSSGLKSVMETGESVQSKINKEMIITIFTPKSPLHDGAIILKNGKIEAARCLLPLSEHERIRNKDLGTRHRAGLGITEVSDAVAIIISEERKVISVAENGKLEYYENKDELLLRLSKAMGKESVANKVKDIFEESELEIEETDDKKD